MKNNNQTEHLQQAVLSAIRSERPLQIVGGGSKAFYGRKIAAEPLLVSEHRGIVNYQPKELVISARCGTPLVEVESVLAEKGQMLAFEPPHLGESATLGGTIACGFSGPRRAYAGSARDFVLGVGMINGRGEHLHFGGEVMKNVAGYDVSRLMTGSLGTLGIILDISLKVLPRPQHERTVVQESGYEQAILRMNQLAATALPVTASCFNDSKLYIRLSGTTSAVVAAAKQIGGEELSPDGFWKQLREMQLAFFQVDKPLWRLSLPSDAAHLPFDDLQLIEWGGALRWLASNDNATAIRNMVSSAGGHATLFKGGNREAEVFHPLADGLEPLHKHIKQAFDPAHIFNPGKMYPKL